MFEIKQGAFIRAIIAMTLAGAGGAALADCTPADTSKGTLSASHVAVKNEKVTGEIDASGCDIGVYIPDGVKNVTVSAEVHDANQYGVFNNGNARVAGGEIYNIGHHSGGVFQPNGSQTGVGVYFFDATGSVIGNDIHDYQKGGIVINGLSMANVSDNGVTGALPVTYIAQNGIQFGYGAKGHAMRNVVSGNWYLGANWTSTGILVFETGNVSVQDNAVQGSQTGISIEAWCWIEPSADNNRIVNNSVQGAQYAVTVAAYSLGGYSTCDASADNNKVTNNLLDSTPSPGDIGIFLGTGQYYGGTDTPTADNNKLIHNQISGFTDNTYQSGDSSSKVHANVID